MEISPLMNVAIAVKSFPPDVIGGMETQTKQMATALIERGHTVTVYTKRYGNHDDSDVEYDVVRVPNIRRSPFFSDLSFLVVCLMFLIRDSRKYDLLQCMMFYPVGFLGYVLNRTTGLPYFAWIRGGDYYLMRDVGWKRWMMRRVLGDTLVLAQSSEIRDDVIDDFPTIESNIEVLGNAVTIPEDTAKGDGILYVGRLAPKKGLAYLIEAMELVEAPLTIVGDGPERTRLLELVEQVDADITIIGEVPPDAVGEYFRTAGIFVLPSIEGEGTPNALLEAMAWGLPVVATESGGVPSLIADGETGYLVSMRDPSELAATINHLLSDDSAARMMGTRAREYVRTHHSWDSLVDRLEEIYHHVERGM